MIIKWREQSAAGEVTHEFDWQGSPRTQEMRWIKERTEFRTTVAFLEALEEMDPDAIIALIIILSARHGRQLKWDQVDVDPLNDLDYILSEEERKRSNLIKLLEDGKSGDDGKGKDLPVPTSGTSNGHLSAAVLKPNASITLPPSGDATVSPT